MRLKNLNAKIVIPAFFLLLLLFYLFYITLKSNVVIRLHDDQIDIQKFTNAIAEFIIENGYGYRVEQVECTIKEIHGRLVRGDIDITLELWKGNNLVWYNKEIDAGNIHDLGVLYSGGRQYWIIPKWYARENQIKTVFDMSRHWRDFANPEDPSKGIFFNCIFGWVCRDINSVKLEAYGLDRYYNTVSPISPEALKSIYENALAMKMPVFGYYWEPNTIMANQDWTVLKEPEYTEATWLRIIESATDPNNAPAIHKACEYNIDKVNKIANRNLIKKAPDVAAMFKKMQINIQFFNEMLASRDKNNNDVASFEQLAQVFLKNHPDQWTGWVTRTAQKKIEQALINNEPASDRQ